MLQIEALVDEYVKCWLPNRPTYSGEFEDNDFGCEHLQIFRSGFNIEDFSHDELSKLAVLLTRELRGQINRDHKLFWAWCAFLIIRFEDNITLFKDRDWSIGFRNLISLVLSSKRRFPAGQEYLTYLTEALRYVNSHLLDSSTNKHQIAGPLVYSILEGLLRRKNNNYVDIAGSVIRRFRISNPRNRTGIKSFNPKGRNNRLNRINDSIRCFEELVTVDRVRYCPYLQQIKIEISSLYPSRLDVYDVIDIWRNELIHGKEFWQNKVPILLNLLCLLIIDEIEPSLYDTRADEIKRHLEWIQETRELSPIRAPWDIFPPDIGK